MKEPEDYINDYTYEDYSYDYDYDPSIDCSKYGKAKEIKEALDNKKCSEFVDEGYQCVPFYVCNEGEIITHGGGVFSIRGNKSFCGRNL